MTDQKESDLNILQTEEIAKTNVDCGTEIFIKNLSEGCVIQNVFEVKDNFA